jgi:hypothetical protein
VIIPQSSSLNKSHEQSTINKIEFEQRRRNQIYMKLDYLLSLVSYFDFFSTNAFQIIKLAKESGQLSSSSISSSFITDEFLLLAFFSSNSQIVELLKEYDITQEKFLEASSSSIAISSLSEKSLFFKIKQVFGEKNEKIKFEYSPEVNLLFEKAAENALIRFKTPIISSEILFLTILENSETKTIKIFKNLIANDINLYLLRYKLIKRIHNEESSIRENIVKNQHFFAYLLKTQLNEIEFERLIKNELISTGVNLFRNTLVSKVLKIKLNELLEHEIYKSMKLTNQRNYSI